MYQHKYTYTNAVFDEFRFYRYRLIRRWGGLFDDERHITFVCLNPSTADEKTDDPTIRRCVGFAEREGYTQLELVNLFAVRATSPKDMMRNNNPIGEVINSTNINTEHIKSSCTTADKVVLAYGNHGLYKARHYNIVRVLKNLGIELHCFGVTKSSTPKHPLYLSAKTKIVEYKHTEPKCCVNCCHRHIDYKHESYCRHPEIISKFIHEGWMNEYKRPSWCPINRKGLSDANRR